MLHLVKDGDFVAEVAPGDRFTLPDGSMVSPAYVGWENEEGYSLIEAPPPPPPPLTDADIDLERDRRLYGTFMFAGKPYDSDRDSQSRISGAAVMASLAIMNGAQPGDLRWHGGTEDFSWIAADNTVQPMDAYFVIAFGRAAAAHVKAHVFAARALKDMIPIPTDYMSDTHWP